MNLITRKARKIALPAVVMALAISSPIANVVSAQQTPPTSPQGGTVTMEVPTDSDMVRLTIEIPASMVTGTMMEIRFLSDEGVTMSTMRTPINPVGSEGQPPTRFNLTTDTGFDED